jgi:uncharacterized protein YjbI with pentapeptide repeats
MLDKNQVIGRLSQSPDGSTAVLYGAYIASLDFRGHTFDGAVNFKGAIFTGAADFSGAVFKRFATFDSAQFRQSARFRRCRFEQGAQFSLAAITEEADFFQTVFYGRAMFWRTRFQKRADFSQIKVARADWLPPRYDGQLNLSWARFYDKALFTYAEVEWPVHLHRTVFADHVYFDQCTFDDAVCLNGRENEVLFPRFDVIDPAKVAYLEANAIVRSDTERHREYQQERVSEFVCFNNVLSDEDLCEKLEALPNSVLTPQEIGAIRQAWAAGARKMFADDHLVSFRGTTFRDLDKLLCKYVNLDNVIVDREIAGTPTERRAFEARLKPASFDVFISYASEDKETIVRPLGRKLQEMGYAVWLDESEMEGGEELVTSLDSAMLRARVGVMVVSPAFVGKKWTQYEVDRLLQMSRESGKKLLVVWHKVDEERVRAWSAAIAGRRAFATERYDINQLALQLARAIR